MISKKILALVLGVVAVGAVGAAVVVNNNGGFTGSIKDLKNKPVITAKTEPGKTGVEHTVGKFCLTFKPIELRQAGLKVGALIKDGLKTLDCTPGNKLQKVAIEFKGSNVELGDIRIKLNDQDVTEKLTLETSDRLLNVRTSLKGSVEFSGIEVIEFAPEYAIELTENSALTFEANVLKMNVGAKLSTNFKSVDFIENEADFAKRTQNYDAIMVETTVSDKKMQNYDATIIESEPALTYEGKMIESKPLVMHRDLSFEVVEYTY